MNGYIKRGAIVAPKKKPAKLTVIDVDDNWVTCEVKLRPEDVKVLEEPKQVKVIFAMA